MSHERRTVVAKRLCINWRCGRLYRLRNRVLIGVAVAYTACAAPSLRNRVLIGVAVAYTAAREESP